MAPIAQGVGKLYYAKATVLNISGDTCMVKFEDGIENVVVSDMCYILTSAVVWEKSASALNLLQLFVLKLAEWSGLKQQKK